MPTVGIVDYGMGNLRSVEKGFEKVGMEARLCSDPDDLGSYDGIVLPGVGAFGDAMANLGRLGLDDAVLDYVDTGRPFLGICLGMQLLMEYSEEHGRFEGLGLVQGGALRLPDTVKVPHMGWNVLDVVRENPLLDDRMQGERFYFVHSFYCAPSDDSWTIATTPYGLQFTSALGKNNVWGVQFHPEKSSRLGLEILADFARMAGA